MEQMNDAQDWTQVAEIELVYKSTVKPTDRPIIRQSSDSYKLLLSVWDRNLIELQEQFKVLLLNRARRVLGLMHHSTGCRYATLADIPLILVAAIKSGATNIIVAHNHPSGNLQPSNADLTLTKKLKEVASYLDLRLDDHIILTLDNFYSFADEGVL